MHVLGQRHQLNVWTYCLELNVLLGGIEQCALTSFCHFYVEKHAKCAEKRHQLNVWTYGLDLNVLNEKVSNIVKGRKEQREK